MKTTRKRRRKIHESAFTPKIIAAAWEIYGTRSDAMRTEAAIKKFQNGKVSPCENPRRTK